MGEVNPLDPLKDKRACHSGSWHLQETALHKHETLQETARVPPSEVEELLEPDGHAGVVADLAQSEQDAWGERDPVE